MADDLDALFSQAQGQQEDGGDELRPPKKLKSAENVLSAMRWVNREMLRMKIPADKALSMTRSLALLRLEIEAVSPETLDLPTVRRLEAAQIDREENQRLKQRLARYEDVDTQREAEPTTGLFLRGADPLQVTDRRQESQPEMEPEPAAPHSLSAVLVADASRERKPEENGPTW